MQQNDHLIGGDEKSTRASEGQVFIPTINLMARNICPRPSGRVQSEWCQCIVVRRGNQSRIAFLCAEVSSNVAQCAQWQE